MALYSIVNDQVAKAQDIQQVINVLQQPASGIERGKYQLNGNSYVTGGIISEYHGSLSRNTVPVSVSIDTADFTPSVCTSPVNDNVSEAGFHVKTTSTAINANCNVGGNTTINY